MVPVVFLDIVKVIPPDDGGPVHLQLGDHTGEDTATDGNLQQKEMRIEITISILKMHRHYNTTHDTTTTNKHLMVKTFPVKGHFLSM